MQAGGPGVTRQTCVYRGRLASGVGLCVEACSDSHKNAVRHTTKACILCDPHSDSFSTSMLKPYVSVPRHKHNFLHVSVKCTPSAKATQADYRQMRSISVPTMVFLPATFVAVSLGPRPVEWVREVQFGQCTYNRPSSR